MAVSINWKIVKTRQIDCVQLTLLIFYGLYSHEPAYWVVSSSDGWDEVLDTVFCRLCVSVGLTVRFVEVATRMFWVG